MSNSQKYATHHIKAEQGEIASTVIMMGDPLRAKYMAQTYIENAKLICDIRGINIWTGTYNGKEITVMGHGMGFSSMAIYAHELFEFFGVETIIRLGSCASYDKDLGRESIIVGEKYYTYSRFGEAYGLDTELPAVASQNLVNKFEEVLKTEDVVWKTGGVYSSEWFYAPSFFGEGVKRGSEVASLIEQGKIIGKEMESYALQVIANHFNKEAITIITVIDNLTTKDFSSADDKVNTTKMLEVALKVL